MEGEPSVIDALLLLLAFLGIFGFAVIVGVARGEKDLREQREKKEQEQRERVKALYPEPPSYEERMGVSYGRNDDEQSTE